MKPITSEAEARRLFSGFVPPVIRKQIEANANREPTEAEIAAAKALLAKVSKSK